MGKPDRLWTKQADAWAGSVEGKSQNVPRLGGCDGRPMGERSMQTIIAWAHRNNVPHAAMSDLLQVLGMAVPPPTHSEAGGEASVQAAVRLEAARRGVRLWRNNSGVAMNDRGQPIRFGVANESAAVNKVFKSSDLIGVGPDGRFWAIECKAPGWKYRESDQRAVAQGNFIKLITAAGGVGKFVTCVGDLP